MTTIKDRLDELGDTGDKIVGYSVVGSMMNILYEALDEMGEDELSEAITELQKKIWDKQNELMCVDIEGVN
jgi:hypothetical protein